MQRFFESKYAFFTLCVLFTLALLWNLGHGSTAQLEPHALAPESVLSAHGATAPPDPWEGSIRIAHGATAPPDPWEGSIRIAHGATAPPDPWDGSIRIAHGATAPPDPWEGSIV